MATRILIASTVLGSDAASITFSDIPQTFDDLLLVCSLRSDIAAAVWLSRLRFNGASDDANMLQRYLDGQGSSGAGSGTETYVGARSAGSTATASTFASSEILIPNYAGATNKSLSMTTVSENNNTVAAMRAVAGLWSSTAAITSISLVDTVANLVTGSSAYLYGLKH